MEKAKDGIKGKVVDTKIEGRHPDPQGSESVSTFSKTAPKFPGNVPEGNKNPRNRDTIKPYNTKA